MSSCDQSPKIQEVSSFITGIKSNNEKQHCKCLYIHSECKEDEKANALLTPDFSTLYYNQQQNSKYWRALAIFQFIMIVIIFIFVIVIVILVIYAAITVQTEIDNVNSAIKNNAVVNFYGKVKGLVNKVRPKGDNSQS